jgi:cytochrome P450
MEEHRPSDWRPISEWESMRDPATTNFGAFLAGMRAECPVAWAAAEDVGTRGGWFVFGHDLVVKVARGFKTFSNVTDSFGKMKSKPLASDPPEHSAYRRMLNPWFTGDRLAVREPEIRADLVSMLDPLVQSGGGDFVATIAKPLPMRAFCRICGIPAEDHDYLLEAEARLFQPGFRARSPEQMLEASKPLLDYCASLVSQRRAAPGADVVSAMVSVGLDGQPLSDQDAVEVLFLLIGAGHRTTTSAVASAARLLAEHPEAQARLRAAPELIPSAVEEILRYEPSTMFMPRIALEGITLEGRTIAPGDWIYPVWPSANFDPDVFTDPERFDIERSPNRHLTFGRGIHLCLGASLARMEIAMTLEELLRRTTAFDVDGTIERGNWPDHVPTSLPMVFSAVDASVT